MLALLGAVGAAALCQTSASGRRIECTLGAGGAKEFPGDPRFASFDGGAVYDLRGNGSLTQLREGGPSGWPCAKKPLALNSHKVEISTEVSASMSRYTHVPASPELYEWNRIAVARGKFSV